VFPEVKAMKHDLRSSHRRFSPTGSLWTAACALALSAAGGIAACGENSPKSWSVGVGDAGPASATVGRNLRRLSRREYNNVVRDLLGDTTQPANQFGQEVYTNGFDNGSDGLTVQGADLLALQAAAEALAATAVASHPELLIGTCNPQTNEMPCVNAFVSTFVPKAYRRPPTATEVQRLQTVYAAGAAAGGFTLGLQTMLEAVLQSPSFLYREELGAPDPSLPAGVVRLTDYEIASELSFLFTGSMPDAQLSAAAQAGALKTGDQLKAQATRLLATAGAKTDLRSFVHQWMATDQVSSADKDAIAYPTFTPALAASMSSELDQFYDNVLWQGAGSIRELLTSNQSFVDKNLATLVYQIPPPATGFQAVTLDPQIRQGVMTRAGFLTAHSDVDSSGPVPRGVFVLYAMLCTAPISPPPNIPLPPSASAAAAAHETTRQRFSMHLSQPFCNSCHSVIDGIGFGFEQFDGTGAYRTTENGSPVDTSGTVTGTDVDGPFVGVSQLSQKLLGSQEVLSCYVKHVYRFAMGQEESPASHEVLTAMQSAFTADSHMTDPFQTLVADPAFVLRTTLGTGM
jgi:hypothetical protein